MDEKEYEIQIGSSESEKMKMDRPVVHLKKERKRSYVWVYFLVFFLGIGVTFGAFYVFRDSFIGSSSSNGACYTSCENKVTINEAGISDAVDKIYDAVVLVENYRSESLYATGTGFVYKVDSKYGYLLTNYHVIADHTNLKVIMSDDSEVNAKYVGGDTYLDIAVLTIPKDAVKKVAEIGSSTDSKLGDTVFTVGTPVDYEYRGTVTRGILSGKDRLVSVSSSSNTSSSTDSYIAKVLQTDAAINPGNSGGPLVNSNGEVIGINSLKIVKDEIEGMGFAIAIEDVMSHIDVLEKGDSIVRPYLGISMLNATDTYALYRNGIMIDKDITSGVVVVSTTSDGSVGKLLKKGDVILKMDDVEVKNSAYLRYELFKHNVGDKVSITYRRDGKTSKIQIVLKKGA